MNLSPVFKQRFFDLNGQPLAGGFIYTYQAGTTTPQVSYSNSTGTTNSNPVVLDSSGYADIWFDPTLSYKVIVQDSNSVQQWSVDNISFPVGISTWSANINYSQGSVVQDSSGFGLLYVSLINNNLNNALTSVSSWRVIGGNVRTVSTNTTLLVTDDMIRSNSTSGNLTHTLPSCASTPIGKVITVKDVGTGGNATTLKGSGTDVIDGNNTYSTTLSQFSVVQARNNGTSWDVISLPDNSVTQSKLAPRATGTTVGTGGVAISASSGSFSTTSTSVTPVTNLSVTITTTGRPVMLMVQSDGPTNTATIGLDVAGEFALFFQRGGTNISKSVFDSAPTGTVGLPLSPCFLDTPSAGTYTYSLAVAVNFGSPNQAIIQNCVLVAYEL